MSLSFPFSRPIASPIAVAISWAIRGSSEFDPLSLSPVVYYDPSDMTTLFQNSAGTTPVTAAGQPVGLMLDKSQGLALGPERIVNGDFSGGYTVDGSGRQVPNAFAIYVQEHVSAMTVSEGGCIFTATDHLGGIANGGAPLDIEGSAKVLIRARKLSESSGTPSLNVLLGTWRTVVPAGATLNQWYTLDAVLAVKASNYEIANFSGAATWEVEYISVKELPGNHASQPTASKRPLTAGSPIYADFDGVDDELVTTFAASLGTGCTVCRSLPGTGASITTGVTIGTTFTDNVDAHALLIFTAAQWTALDAGQIAKITTWLNGRAGL